MANLVKRELRKLQTHLQIIIIPTFYIDSDTPEGFTITPSQIQGSMVLTNDNVQWYSPIPSGEKDYFSDHVWWTWNNWFTFGNSDGFYFTGSLPNLPYDDYKNSGYMPYFLVTANEKHYMGFFNPNRDVNRNSSIVQCTSTQYGYWIGGTDTEFTFSESNYTDPYIEQVFSNSTVYIEDTDPYKDGGESTTGGGDGTFDGTSDPVEIPPLPTVGATDAGFITLFAPTQTQLKSLAQYMWSSAFDIEGGGTALAFKKLFNDPMDCILGLSVVPVSVPTSGAREITIGNLVTTVQMNVASQQYVEVDCGSISFANKYFGSYLDYEPYTKMAIFVPYSGVHAISADDIMGKTVTLKYHIDILTGSLVAFLKCGNSVLYEFNGACASNIPVNSLNYASTIENSIRIAVNIGTTVATAGAAAPATGALTGKAIAQGVALAGSTAEGALSMKPSIDRAGCLGGTTGLMGNQIPYIIITRPRLCKPKNQNHYIGYPSFIEVSLSDLTGQGYTEFNSVVLDSLYLTNEEKKELENILYSGVFL